MARPVLMWFRNDLRLTDNPALAAASQTGAPVVPVYVLDDETPGRWALGGAGRWWLHHSLAALASDLARHGGMLVLRHGHAEDAIPKLARELDAIAVHCSRGFEPWAGEQERRLHDALAAEDIPFRRFAGTLLHDPDNVQTKAGKPFKIYTPFWRNISASAPRTPLPAATRLTFADTTVASERLADWRLLPTGPNWAGGLRETWSPGEATARARLDAFLEQSAASYNEMRDRPDRNATSRLSPHLRFGEISPAACWHAALAKAAQTPQAAQGLEAFRKELAWREFSYHLLYHWPQLPEAPFREQFAAFPWAVADHQRRANLTAWQKGRTGYPIVDAGMRQLWRTGWMHNRVRMITASFLIKHLLIPWQEGEAWFWDCLVDADLASNAASWQWVAGSGADAAPYFRIFNPMTQGKKFDPEGDYVRRWIPEISTLPAQYIHAPWTCPEVQRKAAGITLGETYPWPIVEHADARKTALRAYEQTRGLTDGSRAG